MSKAQVIPLFEDIPIFKHAGFVPKEFGDKSSREKYNQQEYVDWEEPLVLNSQESETIDEQIDETLSVNSDWVKENIARGYEGEEFVKDILISLYGENNVRKEPDSAGYDFWVKAPDGEKRIEVKTTNSKKHPFFISINELEKANKYKAEYYIYLVIMEQNKAPIIYIITNPILTLDINMEYIKRELATKLCQIQTESFKIKISEKAFTEINNISILEM